MNSTDLVLTVRVTWLILCGMMLFSRFVFQATGSVWMRGFLDAWKYSRTHRVWGFLAFLYALAILIPTVRFWRQLDLLDLGVTLALVFILCADGLLNLLPSWFGHFKERMQDAWVKRHGASERATDKHLFGTVNFFLGLASLLVAILIYWYKPLEIFWLAFALIVSIILMSVLIGACKKEGIEPRAGSDTIRGQ